MNPEEYKQNLKKLHVEPLCNLQPGLRDMYGVIKRSFDLKQSARGDKDWKVTLYIADPTYDGVDITALLFHKDRHALDRFKENSILILRNANVREFNNKKQVILNASRKVALFPPASDQPEKIEFSQCPLDGDDLNIVRYLQKWNASSESNDTTSKLASRSTGRQCLEVKDILNDKRAYMDFVGQVVDVRKDEKVVELLLTDYTQNPQSNSSLEERDNLRVGVEFLILCGLWDEHGRNCQDIKPGDYVSLTNCKKKMGNSLELNIHGDKENKQRVLKIEADDPRLQQLILRQMNHSGKEVKKKRKLTSFQSYALESNLLLDYEKSTRIKTILSERDVDKSYKILAYIKDYQPKNIKDWIRGWCSSCNKSSPPTEPCTQCQKPTESIYKFALLVNDDSGAELTLYGFGYEALKLFPTISPEEAFKNDDALLGLKRIVELACNESKQHFDIALKPYFVKGQDYFNYQIVDTQFT